MQSKKPLIIKAISEMNISLLEVLLDDNQTYQGATKDIFIEKLDEVFKQFKERKDSMLLPFSGFCKSKSCENKGCKGLAFIGNVSNISMDLIFDEVDNDFKDIYRCSKFKIEDKTIKPTNTFVIDIKQDEKVKFNPTPEKLEIFQECKKAFDEIITPNTTVLSKDKLIKWFENYTWLRESFNNNIDFFPFLYRSVDDFRDLYCDLKKVVEHIPFEILAFNAMADFQSINVSIETELLNWLAKYEDLRYDLSKLNYPFEDDGVIKRSYSRIPKPKIKIDLEEFKNVIQFRNIFDYYKNSTSFKISTIKPKN